MSKIGIREVVIYLGQNRFSTFDILFASAFTLALTKDGYLAETLLAVGFLLKEIGDSLDKTRGK